MGRTFIWSYLMPNNSQINQAWTYFEKKHDFPDSSPALNDLDIQLRQTYKAKKLSKLLNEIQTYHSPFTTQDLNHSLIKNMPYLLHNSWTKRKTSEFFKVLNRYVQANNLFISDYFRNKLVKKSRPLTQRFFHLQCLATG
ncbi:MAG: hypothetical protein HRU09_10510 [Oligoflexales bacterium]|nr:hypothetical protein [Oligoflexales bacterium]